MSCHTNPPAPNGFAVWKGAVPPALSAWSLQLLKGVSKVPFGTTWSQTYNGMLVIARKDTHTWHYLPDGTLLTDLCWSGITLYKPMSVGGSVSAADVVTDIETATPDPSLAVYDVIPGPNWPLVAASGAAALGVVGLFWLAVRLAGRAAKRQT